MTAAEDASSDIQITTDQGVIAGFQVTAAECCFVSSHVNAVASSSEVY